MTGWIVSMNDESSYIRLQQASPIPLDVEFSCRKGEILVLVGPSGSGKTTTLRCIAGLYKPTAGKIICQGNTWLDTDLKINIPVQQRAVGIVFQHYALFPHLTVSDNIAIAMGKGNRADTRSRVTDLLDMMHLAGLDQRYPHKLSGGQQQRVALARALARKPDILLLDEPFSALDQQIRRHLVRELVQLRNQVNIPIIHVTHNLNEARRIADVIGIIDNGQLLQIGAPNAVMNKPVNARVAGLLGHDNIFTGAIHAQDEENGITWIEWYQHIFATRYQPGFTEKEIIDWMIPSSQVHLFDASDSETTVRSNIVRGRITEYVQLGEGTHVTMMIEDTEQELSMNISTPNARSAGLATGATIQCELLADGIHLMEKI